MLKIDIISGFLGAGKTTLIKKLLEESLSNEKVVLIENEFGEIGIDGGFLKEAGVEITEMNSGCICCSLVGDFAEALHKVIEELHPDRIMIEPSGVGKLSDVIKAVEDVAAHENVILNSALTVVDVLKCKVYMKNFGEFFNNQIANASVIVLSRTQKVEEETLLNVIEKLKEQNPSARMITTPWDEIAGDVIVSAMQEESFEKKTMDEEVCSECGHIHHHKHEHECECGHEHHHEHDHECECGHEHHHEHDHECECGHEHHHEHDHECECGHEHHHEHDHECECGHEHHHEHDHECKCGHDHHHHHADDVFTSWGVETPKTYTKEQLEEILEKLSADDSYGVILRAKGMVCDKEHHWMYFDMVPEEYEIREGNADYTGKICVIGSNLKEDKLKQLFQLEV